MTYFKKDAKSMRYQWSFSQQISSFTVQKTPSEMIMLRRTKTKIPSLRKVAEPDIRKEAKPRDGETRAARKQVFDKTYRVREQIIQTGDQDLIKQQKTIVNLPF